MSEILISDTISVVSRYSDTIRLREILTVLDTNQRGNLGAHCFYSHVGWAQKNHLLRNSLHLAQILLENHARFNVYM